jgi:hypothetical protein
MKLETCHVYLVAHKNPDGFYEAPVKIGITHSLKSRMKSLQTGNPKPIGLVFAFSTPDVRFAKHFERGLHEVNAEFRLNGEWFNMDPRHALIDMVGAFWGILQAELGDDKTLFQESMTACGAGDAMQLLRAVKGPLPH